MFDLQLKNDLDDVPVPLLGRAILFADGGGVLRARLHDGSIVEGLRGADGAAGVAGAQGLPGVAGAQGVPGDVGPRGLQGLQGVQGVQGVAGPAGGTGADGMPGAAAASRLLAVSPKWLGRWTTTPANLLQFNAAALFAGDGALSFFVLGSNTHKATAANLTVQLKVGGVVALSQVFALGTTAKTDRAWRVEGCVVFDGANHAATMRASVDGIAAQTDVGNGVAVADSAGLYVEVVAFLSAAVAGANLSLINGYAVREW